jgi:glycosyltransferase involved in cell wall biosynthesis
VVLLARRYRHLLEATIRIVFITQQIDPAHPVLAATMPKIEALALTAEVSVLAGGVGADPPPVKARIRRFAAPTKVGRGLRFEVALARELASRPRPVAVVAHMCPIYAVLAAPLARPIGVPVLLWYTHWRAGPMLRVAERLSSVVLSVDRRSFPLPSRKVQAIGHGIELAEFPCAQRVSADTLRLLALGRYSPAKGLDVIIEALAGVDATLTVHGPALTDAERAHREQLERLAQSLGLAERVRLEGPVPRSRVPSLLAEADLLVNNMRPGAADKVVYEAAASCVPALASGPVFDDLLPAELRFAPDDPAELAERLREFARLDDSARAELGKELRRRVAERHSVQNWAERVLAAAGAR